MAEAEIILDLINQSAVTQHMVCSGIHIQLGTEPVASIPCFGLCMKRVH